MLHNSDDVTSSVAEPVLFLVGAGVKMWKQKHVIYYFLAYFFYEEEPEPVKEVPGAEAGQK